MLLHKCGHQHKENSLMSDSYKQTIRETLCHTCYEKELKNSITRWAKLAVDRMFLSTEKGGKQ